jgi:subtilisin family serine protease
MAVVGSGFLLAGGAQYLDLTLQGNTTYQVYVHPDDPSVDFDLRIVDQNGNVVAQDMDTTSNALCYITPAWTGLFRLIVNASAGSSWYQVRVEA